MSSFKQKLHVKRAATEENIKRLEAEGRAGERYTAKISDMRFFVFGILSDIGWIMQLIAQIKYLAKHGVTGALSVLNICVIAGLVFSVGYFIYLNKIHENEIATRLQKDFSFGLISAMGICSAILGIVQMFASGADTLLVVQTVGGLVDAVFGMPIFLSFKKGIIYGSGQ